MVEMSAATRPQADQRAEPSVLLDAASKTAQSLFRGQIIRLLQVSGVHVQILTVPGRIAQQQPSSDVAA